jgi:hypothetical protein
MPTGYTADIEKGITFQQFALNCARAFGACVTMREDPSDKPIPNEFKPSDYHKKQLAKAERELRKIQTISPEEASRQAETSYQNSKRANDGYIKNCINLRAKYNAMLTQVRAWNPPSKNHSEFKQFMIQQIESSIRFDCGTDYHIQNAPKLMSGKKWRQEQIRGLHQDIEYHTKETHKETERTNGRNLWIKQLRESLAKT